MASVTSSLNVFPARLKPKRSTRPSSPLSPILSGTIPLLNRLSLLPSEVLSGTGKISSTMMNSMIDPARRPRMLQRIPAVDYREISLRPQTQTRHRKENSRQGARRYLRLFHPSLAQNDTCQIPLHVQCWKNLQRLPHWRRRHLLAVRNPYPENRLQHPRSKK